MTDAVCVGVSGLAYDEQEEIIERVARNKGYQYRNVGFYDVDDLMQEVRIKCWQAIEKYNPACGANLFVFLSVCAENRIRDIKRSVLYKHNKPCMKCPSWMAGAAASGQHDCRVYWDKMDCVKYAKHERYVQAKLSASHPIDIDGERIESEEQFTHTDRVDLVDFIESRIALGLLGSFRRFKQNNYNPRSLKNRERVALMQALRNILKDWEV